MPSQVRTFPDALFGAHAPHWWCRHHGSCGSARTQGNSTSVVPAIRWSGRGRGESPHVAAELALLLAPQVVTEDLLPQAQALRRHLEQLIVLNEIQ